MQKLLDVTIGCTNLIISVWLGHWAWSHWDDFVKERKNGLTVGMVALLMSLSMDRLRISIKHFSRLNMPDRTIDRLFLFEHGIQIANSLFVIGTLKNLYQMMSKEEKNT